MTCEFERMEPICALIVTKQLLYKCFRNFYPLSAVYVRILSVSCSICLHQLHPYQLFSVHFLSVHSVTIFQLLLCTVVVREMVQTTIFWTFLLCTYPISMLKYVNSTYFFYLLWTTFSAYIFVRILLNERYFLVVQTLRILCFVMFWVQSDVRVCR